MEKQEKIAKITELLKNKQKPNVLNKWLATHSENEAQFYLIWRHTTGRSILNLDSIDGYMPFYREGVSYEFVFGGYSFNDGDEVNLKYEYSEGRSRIVKYYPGSQKFIYYDKSTGQLKYMNDLREVPDV